MFVSFRLLVVESILAAWTTMSTLEVTCYERAIRRIRDAKIRQRRVST